MPLDEFDPSKYDRKTDANISFGYYQEAISEIRKTVAKVDPDWAQYYTEDQRIYCGFIDGKTASFCTITDFGIHKPNGQKVKVGGPGCVGTLPCDISRNRTSHFRAETERKCYREYAILKLLKDGRKNGNGI